MARLSKEKVEMIRKFCMTHPKRDAALRFGVYLKTIYNHTKGINCKKSLQENLEVINSGATFKKN